MDSTRARLDILNARIELWERAVQRKRDANEPIQAWHERKAENNALLIEARKEHAEIVESLWR